MTCYDRLQNKCDIFKITDSILTLSPGSSQREELRSDHDVPIVTAGTCNFLILFNFERIFPGRTFYRRQKILVQEILVIKILSRYHLPSVAL